MTYRKLYLPVTLLATIMVSVSCSSPKEEKATVAATQQLIPDGFEILDTDTLSIGIETFVINALKYIQEDSLSDLNPNLIRPLTILKKVDGLEYELMARNDSVILCRACGGIFGDPWEDLQTEENSFIIYHMGGSSDRWTRNLEFYFNQEKGGWFLISDRGVSFSTHDPEGSFEEHIYTPDDSLGLVPFESFKTEF